VVARPLSGSHTVGVLSQDAETARFLVWSRNPYSLKTREISNRLTAGLI
jgi:hypothetical protein